MRRIPHADKITPPKRRSTSARSLDIFAYVLHTHLPLYCHDQKDSTHVTKQVACATDGSASKLKFNIVCVTRRQQHQKDVTQLLLASQQHQRCASNQLTQGSREFVTQSPNHSTFNRLFHPHQWVHTLVLQVPRSHTQLAKRSAWPQVELSSPNLPRSPSKTPP